MGCVLLLIFVSGVSDCAILFTPFTNVCGNDSKRPSGATYA